MKYIENRIFYNQKKVKIKSYDFINPFGFYLGYYFLNIYLNY